MGIKTKSCLFHNGQPYNYKNYYYATINFITEKNKQLLCQKSKKHLKCLKKTAED